MNHFRLKYIDIFESLRNMFIYLESNAVDSPLVTNLNYAGYIVKLDFFEELQLSNVVKFHKTIPYLKPSVVYFKTDPNLELSSINTDNLNVKNDDIDTTDKTEFSTETNVLDRYSNHLHKVKGTSNDIFHNNTCGAINFPLINCNHETTTKWLRLISGNPQINKYLSRGDNCNFEEIESTFLIDNEPNIIRLEQWHSVINKSQKLRVIANIDFQWHMSWDDIQYAMKDYIL